mmetsp:Transcript_98708/g.156025  ORF Transcript_98708/g.156025 Transcript_98708/m.156025 type:complete len:147 (-) Transcript_98708:104-544(-)
MPRSTFAVVCSYVLASICSGSVVTGKDEGFEMDSQGHLVNISRHASALMRREASPSLAEVDTMNATRHELCLFVQCNKTGSASPVGEQLCAGEKVRCECWCTHLQGYSDLTPWEFEKPCCDQQPVVDDSGASVDGWSKMCVPTCTR